MYRKKINELFTKENVEKIIVPEIVKVDLLSIIEEKLKKAGFYYRIVYRVKEADSMVNKLIYKDYGRVGTQNHNKKMQDLVGIRIILYFSDDVDICRNLLDTLFSEPGQWETTENNEYEFKAMKINGIFQLPAYLSKTIVNPVLSDYVDDTFEVQVRTNSFEGWHEIEHDLRYKGSAFGVGNEVLERKMNSILATLELCDDSVVKLLEDLGHQHYKDHKWGDMIRCHYRLKFDSEPIAKCIEKVFDDDTELAKTFFKFNRARVIKHLWENTSDKGNALTVNNIIRIVNQLDTNNEVLRQAIAELDKKDGNTELPAKRKKFEPFKELGIYKVFNAQTIIVNDNLSKSEKFKKASSYIYSWIKSRFNDVFEDIPESPVTYNNFKPGYGVEIIYDEKKLEFKEKTSHPDTRIASRIWISKASLRQTEKGLEFTVSNEYAEPKDRYRDSDNMLFSRPNFYGEIADNLGIYDVEQMKESIIYVRDNELEKLNALIKAENRRFPVVVFMADETEWTEKFDVNYFSYLVGYYAHVRFISGDLQCLKFAKQYGLDDEYYKNSITVFYPGEEPHTNYKSDIIDTKFEVIKFEQKKYWNEKGCRAFRRQLVSQIRGKNVYTY